MTCGVTKLNPDIFDGQTTTEPKCLWTKAKQSSKRGWGIFALHTIKKGTCKSFLFRKMFGAAWGTICLRAAMLGCG